MGTILNALKVFLGGQDSVADDSLKELRPSSDDRDREHWLEGGTVDDSLNFRGISQEGLEDCWGPEKIFASEVVV